MPGIIVAVRPPVRRTALAYKPPEVVVGDPERVAAGYLNQTVVVVVAEMARAAGFLSHHAVVLRVVEITPPPSRLLHPDQTVERVVLVAAGAVQSQHALRAVGVHPFEEKVSIFPYPQVDRTAVHLVGYGFLYDPVAEVEPRSH
jgi:hypothetical protein